MTVCKEGKGSGPAIRMNTEVGTRSNQEGGKQILCLEDKITQRASEGQDTSSLLAPGHVIFMVIRAGGWKITR